MRGAMAMFALAALCAGAARASDGVIEINQVKALAGGVTSCDTPGFPVTLCTPGSYRLTSDLLVPGIDGAIVLDARDSTLDLGGFTVRGNVTCQTAGFPWPSSCSASSGFGAISTNQRSTVRNGRVIGHSMGVVVGDGSIVQDLQIQGNGGTGLFVGTQTLVSRVSLVGNLGDGLFCWGTCVVEDAEAGANQNDGIHVDGIGAISRSSAHENGGAGFFAGPGVQLSRFAAFSNGREGVVAGDGALVSAGAIRNSGWIDPNVCGLRATGGAGYHDVVVTAAAGVNTATVCGAGAVNLGGNACQGAVCP